MYNTEIPCWICATFCLGNTLKKIAYMKHKTAMNGGQTTIINEWTKKHTKWANECMNEETNGIVNEWMNDKLIEWRNKGTNK